MSETEDVTVLLERARKGDEQAHKKVLPLVYAQLRKLAAARMRRAHPEHTLQPTALVHEAYMRVWGDDATFENRAHFYFVASRAMRDILVDHARKKASHKRGGDKVFLSLDDLTLAEDCPPEEMLALDEALKRLETLNSRQYDLVMLRFFGGLTSTEAAQALGVSDRTAERDWRFARTYLYSVLSAPAS